MLAWQVKWANDFSVPVLESQEEEADEEGGRQGEGCPEDRWDRTGGLCSAFPASERGGGARLCCPGLRLKNWPNWGGSRPHWQGLGDMSVLA